LDRAANILYDRTEKIRFLKSKELEGDVLESRSRQIIESQIRKEKEIEEKRAYEIVLSQQLREAEIKEQSITLKKKLEVQAVAKTRLEQLEESKQRKQILIEEEKVIGETMKLQAQQDYLKSLQEHQESENKMKEANNSIIEFNIKFQQQKEELKKKELEAQAIIDKEVDVIEGRNKGRKQIEATRQMNRNKKRQDLIDAATRQLQQISQKENEILLKQEQEINDRANKKEYEKLQKEQKEWNDILLSRTKQIERRRMESEKQQREDKKQIEIFLQQNDLELKKELETQRKLKEDTITIKKMQYEDAAIAKQRKLEYYQRQILEDNAFLESLKTEDNKFIRTCQEKLVEYKMKGKPVYSILRALETYVYKPPRRNEDEEDD
jgi:hypothetical protein